MTTATNTTTATKTAITAFISEDNGNSQQTTFLCSLDDSGEILSAERVVYTINTLHHGSHRSGDGDDYSSFDAALDAFNTYFNEAQDSDWEDFPQSASEIEFLLNRGQEFQVKIGDGMYLCLAKTTVTEALVDAPIYTDEDGRELVICHEDVSNQFVVQVRNLNGTFSVCVLDGEVYSSARSWIALDRVPSSVRKEVETVWEVSA